MYCDLSHIIFFRLLTVSGFRANIYYFREIIFRTRSRRVYARFSDIAISFYGTLTPPEIPYAAVRRHRCGSFEITLRL